MPNRRNPNSSIEWKKYLFELLVIVTGITISFMVQNWREASALKKQEVATLQRLHADLAADTAAMHSEIKAIESIFHSSTKILSFKTLDDVRDSLNFFIGAQLNYTVFTKIDIGYQMIQQAGRTDLISNKELLGKIVHQYSVNYGEVKEWGEIDKTFILEQFIPFFNERFPYVQGFDFVKYWDKLKPVITSDIFRNMVRSNAQFKYQTVAIYQKNLKNIEELMAAIEEELALLR